MTQPEDHFELSEFGELGALLTAERPEVDTEFARKLDEWAAAGFPRGSRPSAQPQSAPAGGGGREGMRGLFDRLSAVPPRRILAPVAAFACLAVVASVSVSQVSTDSGNDPANSTIATEDTDSSAAVLGEAESAQSPAAEAAPGEGRAGAAQDTPEAPEADAAPSPAAPEAVQSDGGAPIGGSGAGATPPPPLTGTGAGEREIAQDVNLELSTEPEELRDVADGVLEVTDRHNGFVVSSNVSSSAATDGVGASGTARFELQIPALQLQATISELSELAHVSSRSDGSVDITGQFKSAERRIAQLSAERDRLLAEIQEAEKDDRRSILRARLDTIRAQLGGAQRDLARAEQRVDLVPVTVTVSTDEPADDGNWSLDEALDDTVDVLTTVAGILLLSAAVLLPLGLIALLVALAWRRGVTRKREQALDGE